MTRLLKKLDEETQKHRQERLGTFAVFCNDDEAMEEKLRAVTAKEKIHFLVVTIDQPSGPSGYKIAKDADVTVVLYAEKIVAANFAYRAGQFTDKETERILAALPKILEPKK